MKKIPNKNVSTTAKIQTHQIEAKRKMQKQEKTRALFSEANSLQGTEDRLFVCTICPPFNVEQETQIYCSSSINQNSVILVNSV